MVNMSFKKLMTRIGALETAGYITASSTTTFTNKTISGADNTLTVREADLSIADNTTANVSASAHGFVAKHPNSTNQFLRGDGAWASPTAASAGNWDRLATASLGADTASLNSGTFTAKKCLMVYIYCPGGDGSTILRVQVNADTGGNYQFRRELNGAQSTGTGETSMVLNGGASSDDPQHTIMHIHNNSASAIKLFQCSQALTTGGTVAPEMNFSNHVWNNTAAQVTSIQCIASTGNLRAGTEIHVFGSD
jgi:hypothetical protein